jgi:hypothetical protein
LAKAEFEVSLAAAVPVLALIEMLKQGRRDAHHEDFVLQYRRCTVSV